MWSWFLDETKNDLDLIEAAKSGDLYRIKELMTASQEGMEPLISLERLDWIKDDKNGNNALIWASANGHLNIVKYLVKNDANVNRQNHTCWSALHYAAKNDYSEIVQFLVENNAVINKKNSDGETALHFASEGGHLDMVKCLIAKGAQVNQQNKIGKTALHFACEGGHVDIVEHLLAFGAQVNLKIQEGRGYDGTDATALHYASRTMVLK